MLDVVEVPCPTHFENSSSHHEMEDKREVRQKQLRQAYETYTESLQIDAEKKSRHLEKRKQSRRNPARRETQQGYASNWEARIKTDSEKFAERRRKKAESERRRRVQQKERVAMMSSWNLFSTPKKTLEERRVEIRWFESMRLSVCRLLQNGLRKHIRPLLNQHAKKQTPPQVVPQHCKGRGKQQMPALCL